MGIKKFIFLAAAAGVILAFSPSVSQAMTLMDGAGSGNWQGDQFSVARFQGFQNGQSDKVPADFASELLSLVLFAMPLFAGLFFIRKPKFAN